MLKNCLRTLKKGYSKVKTLFQKSVRARAIPSRLSRDTQRNVNQMKLERKWNGSHTGPLMGTYKTIAFTYTRTRLLTTASK